MDYWRIFSVSWLQDHFSKFQLLVSSWFIHIYRNFQSTIRKSESYTNFTTLPSFWCVISNFSIGFWKTNLGKKTRACRFTTIQNHHHITGLLSESLFFRLLAESPFSQVLAHFLHGSPAFTDRTTPRMYVNFFMYVWNNASNGVTSHVWFFRHSTRNCTLWNCFWYNDTNTEDILDCAPPFSSKNTLSMCWWNWQKNDCPRSNILWNSACNAIIGDTYTCLYFCILQVLRFLFLEHA